ncbi:AI-2E family transporter [Olsenella sp. YH-ols2217]|uniref:AI-2E family transporter n=1 Tax=Kribbibacterium absianum TaxID=3044210 RepID=A0ABT6ZM45_9ACTN|nr:MULTISPECIES: AI-2E family transporter [unclassified Olsenella]MDJ1122123.1 AI-2E family transporter [Olsenella sp. YH-ols2216]MDJ1130131.1 AI-2E family transporter [Olsenella sp. YH-ols2217]
MAEQHTDGTGHGSSALSLEDRLRMVRVWTCIGVVLIFIAVVVALGYLGPVIEFLGVGIIVGFICSPIVNSLERRGVGRALGALVALIVVLGVATGIVALLGPLFTEQLLSLLEKIPSYLHEVQVWIEGLFEKYGSSATADFQVNVTSLVNGLSSMGSRFATGMASQISSGLLPNLMNIVNVFFMFFLGLVLAYWLARDYPKIVREFAVIAGPKHQEDLTLLLAVASRSMGGYMRGIVITSLVGGVLAFLGFLVVGQPYAPLMGILTGLLHFIPVIGPWFSAAIATVTALFVSPVCALWTLIVAMIAENVTDNVVSPVVMRSAVQVHPAMSLLAIVIGSTLGGAVGMAISIPVSAAIKGVFIYYFETRTGRQIVSYDGAIFQGTPFRHGDGSPAPSFDALDDDHFFATSKLVPEPAEPDVSAETPPEPPKPPITDTIRKHAEDARAIVEEALKRDEDYVVGARDDASKAETPDREVPGAPEDGAPSQPDHKERP